MVNGSVQYVEWFPLPGRLKQEASDGGEGVRVRVCGGARSE